MKQERFFSPHRQITECLRLSSKGFGLLKHSNRYLLSAGGKEKKYTLLENHVRGNFIYGSGRKADCPVELLTKARQP
jgi:hypothetical protein